MSRLEKALDEVFYYLCNCIDDGFFPHEDEVYERFHYIDSDLVEKKAISTAEFHDLSEVEIRWEGNLGNKKSKSAPTITCS